MKKLYIGMIAFSAIATSCSSSSTNNEAITEISKLHHETCHEHHEMFNIHPTYTFMSISTAKPGKLDDLVRIASKPSE